MFLAKANLECVPLGAQQSHNKYIFQILEVSVL